MTDKFVPHCFNTAIAKAYGVNAAILFHGVEHYSRYTPDHFVRATLAELKARHPYLGPKKIRNALRRLTHPRKRNPVLLHRNADDGSFSYSPNCDPEKEPKLHWFDTKLACEVGVVAAIIYQNISFWIKRNWEQTREEVERKIDPKSFNFDAVAADRYTYAESRKAAMHHGRVDKWAEEHPYIALRTVQRGFETLKNAGLLKVRYVKRKTPVWSLPEETLSEYRHVQHNNLRKALGLQLVDGCENEEFAAKRAKSAPKGQSDRQKGNASAKRAGKPESVREESTTYAGTVEANSDEAQSLRSSDEAELKTATCSSFVGTTSRASASPSRIEMTLKEVREQRSKFKPEVQKEIRRAGKPSLPKPKERPVDAWGRPITRHYQFHRKPDDPEFYEYMEDLSPAARQAYISEHIEEWKAAEVAR